MIDIYRLNVFLENFFSRGLVFSYCMRVLFLGLDVIKVFGINLKYDLNHERYFLAMYSGCIGSVLSFSEVLVELLYLIRMESCQSFIA